MAKKEEKYSYIIVESYKAANTSGLHGEVHVRPVAGQGYSVELHVECPDALKRDYPVGSKFKIKAKLTDRKAGGEYLYSSYKWTFDVLS